MPPLHGPGGGSWSDSGGDDAEEAEEAAEAEAAEAKQRRFHEMRAEACAWRTRLEEERKAEEEERKAESACL